MNEALFTKFKKEVNLKDTGTSEEVWRQTFEYAFNMGAKYGKGTSVLQTWVEGCTLRMQACLLVSLRGPDTHAAPNIKRIQRWMRGLVFKPGNPNNVREFMHHEPPMIVEKGQVAKELEFCTQHFYSHLMHGLEVIAWRHPNSDVALKARTLFFCMCALMHLPFETPEAFEKRLGHLEWSGGVQPENFEEALALIERENNNNEKAIKE